jgi:hypothetical protein
MKYRKKPVVVDAVRVRDITPLILDGSAPTWVLSAVATMCVVDYGTHIDVRTLEGTMRGEADDWLIRGVKGELYPCKPDVFEATYERVSE